VFGIETLPRTTTGYVRAERGTSGAQRCLTPRDA
jgi:hypothetical protein